MKTDGEDGDKPHMTWYFDIITVEHHLLHISNSTKSSAEVWVPGCVFLLRHVRGPVLWVGLGQSSSQCIMTHKTTWAQTLCTRWQTLSIKLTRIRAVMYVAATTFKHNPLCDPEWSVKLDWGVWGVSISVTKQMKVRDGRKVKSWWSRTVSESTTAEPLGK